MLTPQQKLIVQDRLNADPKYLDLNAKYKMNIKKGRQIQAMQIKAQMFEYVIAKTNDYEREITSQMLSVKEFTEMLPEKYRQKFRTELEMISMMIDVIDTCVSDINEIAMKMDTPTKIIYFDKLTNIGKEVSGILKHFSHESLEHSTLWADYLDSIERYLYIRASAYAKKNDRLTNRMNRKKQSKSKQS